MARVADPAYQVRAWVYLVHPFLVFVAALGIGLVTLRRSPVLALGGLLGFLLWAFNEAAQQTLTLFAFDAWRTAWPTADAATREAIRTNVMLYDGIWDSLYMLLLIGFAVGNALLGAAAWGDRLLDRTVSACLYAACSLTVALFIQQLGVTVLPDQLLQWAYPIIQPLGRVLIGVWLWQWSTGRNPQRA